ncbi:hypothetical protein S40288_01978 [Stachybotrys chartarum IBT 40288]|nr:hypothetical protein S40288_01978 [Stachybotrys chartarum IBT 40288]
MDEATLGLIIELQLQDIEALASSSKGKQRDGEVPDPVAAVDAYKEELEVLRQSVRDAVMSRSLADAVRLDGDAITALELNEQQAREDRRIAQQIHAGGNVERPQTRPRSNSAQSTLSHVDNDLYEKMLALNVRDEPGESSRRAASLHSGPKQCDICTEERAAYLVAGLPCGHKYCRVCLVQLYTDSLTDESLFPPRCCQRPIPIESAKHLLPRTLLGRFKARETELNTPNRTYCHRPTCSTFIPVQFIVANTGMCPNCRAATCVTCKGAEHRGEDCPKDESTQQVLELARQQGWQRCHSCHRLVELNHGCNHITCKCRAEFCYECGAKWKTCKCAHFQEERLIARANVIVDRNPRAANLTAQVREQMRQREMQNLLQNHECAHRRWIYRGGQHQCEECHHWLPDYIFECNQCHIQACNRCRRNRL